MILQIPGFYYDEFKRKYFKIQPNHTVPPGSAYSSDGVKRRRIQDDADLDLAKRRELRSAHIRRAKILADPFLGGSLSRELGHAAYLDSKHRIFTRGWFGREILRSEADVQSQEPGPFAPQDLPPEARQRTQRPSETQMAWENLNSSTTAMGGFDFDSYGLTLFAPLQGGTLGEWTDRKNALSSNQSDEFLSKNTNYLPAPFERPLVSLISTNESPISSININPATRLLLTTWRAPYQGHNVHLSKMVDTNGPFIPGFSLEGPSIISRIQGDAPLPPTIWAATTGTPSSPFSFVIATEQGVYAMGKNGTDNAFLRPPNIRRDCSAEVLAVECLSNFPSVILGGARNGNISVLDVRVPETQYQSGHAGIFHPSAVAHIKQIRENVITVAGLNSTLCNYDLRYTKQQPRAKIWPNFHTDLTARSMSESHSPGFTCPTLVYPEHENSAYVDLGFDVDAETGIVAAVQHDDANTVKIFSLTTGEVLRSLDATRAGRSIDTAHVKALRFVQDQENRRMKSLWVAKGTKMIRYAW